MIDSSGALTLPPDDIDAIPFFMAAFPQLKATGSSPLRSLDCSTAELLPSSCLILSQSLPEHTCLTSLHLSAPHEKDEAPRPVPALLDTLAAAPTLQNLTISRAPMLPGDDDGCVSLSLLAELTGGLARMPHMHSLTLEDIEYAGPPPLAANRKSGSATIKLRQLISTLEAVARLPHVTRLRLEMIDMHGALPWPSEFPLLRDLDMECWIGTGYRMPWSESEAEVGATRVEHLPRLPSLTRLKFSLSCGAHITDEAQVRQWIEGRFSASWLPIGLGRARRGQTCPVLQHMHLSLKQFSGPLVPSREQRVWERIAGAVRVPPALKHVRVYLKTLSTASAFLDSLVLLTALTTLDFHCAYDADEDGGASLSVAIAESLPTSLVTLHLPSHRDNAGTCAAALCARLGRVTGFTALQLHWIARDLLAPRLPGAAYGAGLRAVTSLRRLQLENCVVSSFEELCSGLATLRHLHFLHLNGISVQVQAAGRALHMAEYFRIHASAEGFARAVTCMQSLELLDLSDTKHVDLGLENDGLEIPEAILAEFGTEPEAICGVGAVALAEIAAALIAQRRPDACALRLAHSEADDCDQCEVLRVTTELAAVNVQLVRGDEKAMGIGVGGFCDDEQ